MGPNEACLAAFDSNVGYNPLHDEVFSRPIFKKTGKRRYRVELEIAVPTTTLSGLDGGIIAIESVGTKISVGSVSAAETSKRWTAWLFGPTRLIGEPGSDGPQSTLGVHQKWRDQMAAANEPTEKHGFHTRHEAADWLVLRSLKISTLWEIRSRFISPLQQLGMAAD